MARGDKSALKRIVMLTDKVEFSLLATEMMHISPDLFYACVHSALFNWIYIISV